MPDLPAPKVIKIPRRQGDGSSWDEIANVFEERANHERVLARNFEAIGEYDLARYHHIRVEILDESAAWARGRTD